jgi:uncharacterized protein with GYD domain
MAGYLMLATFTDQGIRHIKDTRKRANAMQAAAKKLGITVKAIYWTLGQYDAAVLYDAPDDETMTALALHIGAQGNIHTQILRAFDVSEIGSIIAKASKRK